MFRTTTPTQVCRSTSFCELCNPKQKQQEPASEKIHTRSYDLASFFLTFHNPCTCPSWKSQQIYKTINKSVRCNYTLVQVHPSQLQSKLHRACESSKSESAHENKRDTTHLQIENDNQAQTNKWKKPEDHKETCKSSITWKYTSRVQIKFYKLDIWKLRFTER